MTHRASSLQAVAGAHATAELSLRWWRWRESSPEGVPA